MTTLQDILGLITKRKIKTPSDNDYIISAAYTDTQERLKPQPKMEANLLSLGAIKKYVISSIPIGESQTFAQTLVIGNETGGTDIVLSDGDAIALPNASHIKKGSYDFGATGGISRICGVGFEDMWQAGIRYVFDNNGYVRNATNGFEVIPDNTFDITKRFKFGSLWTLDDGTTYRCIDDTEGAAVWELYSSPAPKYKVYTALLTQNGPNNPQTIDTGVLTIGVTYEIKTGSSGSFDFTNVGAPNNNIETFFIATGTTPNDWGGAFLNYNTAAPTAIVLENTIGNIYFQYVSAGLYACKAPGGLFTENKTTIDMDAYCQNGNPGANLIYKDLYDSTFIIGTYKGDFSDGYLSNNRLEIKVYN